jgi:molybdopterin-guanine dinucleotide biosynthesis protein A
MLRGITERDAVVILAGGRATRFPGKLERDIDGVPMVVRVFRSFADRFDVIVSCASPLARSLDARLPCPRVYDRSPDGGPLGGMLSACQALRARRLFVVAGDQPDVDASVFDELDAAWRDGDEAAVPEHSGGIEPLAALYDRRALLRVGKPAFEGGRKAVRAVLNELSTRRVPMSPDRFRNINTPSQLEYHR